MGGEGRLGGGRVLYSLWHCTRRGKTSRGPIVQSESPLRGNATWRDVVATNVKRRERGEDWNRGRGIWCMRETGRLHLVARGRHIIECLVLDASAPHRGLHVGDENAAVSPKVFGSV